MARPSPVPLCPEAKGAKRRPRRSSSMPGPSSCTMRSTAPLRCSARSASLPPPPRDCSASSALAATFSTAVRSAWASPRTARPRGHSISITARVACSVGLSRLRSSSSAPERSTFCSAGASPRWPARESSDNRSVARSTFSPMRSSSSLRRAGSCSSRASSTSSCRLCSGFLRSCATAAATTQMACRRSVPARRSASTSAAARSASCSRRARCA